MAVGGIHWHAVSRHFAERALLHAPALRHELWGRGLPEPLLDAPRPRYDDAVAINDRGDPVWRELALREETAQCRQIEPGLEHVRECPRLDDGHGDRDGRYLSDGANEEV